MKLRQVILLSGLLSGLWLAFVQSAPNASADTFGSGANSFNIDFVTIGNPGNAPDANPNPAGAVDYTYRIGKYEVSEQMIDKANALGGRHEGLARAGLPGNQHHLARGGEV